MPFLLSVTAACSGPSVEDLEGQWASTSGLVIEISGTEAIVSDFGSSPLGSNTAVYAIGGIFLQDLTAIAPGEYSAEVVKGTYDASGKLTGITYQATSILLDPGLNISGADEGTTHWTQGETFTPAPQPFAISTSSGGVLVPRGNTASVTVSVTRSDGFTGGLEIEVVGLPKEIWTNVVTTISGDETETELSFIAQSNAGDEVYPVKLRAARTRGSPDFVEIPFTVNPVLMERDPATHEECRAHWAPIMAAPGNAPADGWEVVSRLKDGVDGPMPDDRYEAWMFSWSFLYGLRSDFVARERIEHTEEGHGAPDLVDASPEGSIVFMVNRCEIGTEPLDPEATALDWMSQWRSWTLVSHRAAGASLSEQLVIRGYGSETSWNAPLYELTLERAQLPDGQ